jgi:hypothetical protein
MGHANEAASVFMNSSSGKMLRHALAAALECD